jgi:D-sedoheptulose 7-phosphate isomerase
MSIFERLIQRYPDLSEALPSILQAAQMLQTCFAGGGKLLVCGNGGSAADSEHIVGELMKGFYLKRPVPSGFRERLVASYPEAGAYLADHLQGALPAISLVSHTSLITAVLNDVAGDMIFAQQVYGYGRPGDVLLGISCSGNAADVLHAFRVARALDVKTLGLTGRSGGGMPPLCDGLLRVGLDSIPDIQERHLAIYHALCAHLEERFFLPE